MLLEEQQPQRKICWWNPSQWKDFHATKGMEILPRGRKQGMAGVILHPEQHYFFKIMFCGCWHGASNHKTRWSINSPWEGVHEYELPPMEEEREKRRTRPEPKLAFSCCFAVAVKTATAKQQPQRRLISRLRRNFMLKEHEIPPKEDEENRPGTAAEKSYKAF